MTVAAALIRYRQELAARKEREQQEKRKEKRAPDVGEGGAAALTVLLNHEERATLACVLKLPVQDTEAKVRENAEMHTVWAKETQLVSRCEGVKDTERIIACMDSVECVLVYANGGRKETLAAMEKMHGSSMGEARTRKMVFVQEHQTIAAGKKILIEELLRANQVKIHTDTEHTAMRQWMNGAIVRLGVRWRNMTRGMARAAMSEAVTLPGGSDTTALSLRKYVVQRAHTHDGRRMAKQDDRAGGEPSAGGEDAAPRAAGKRRAQDTDMNERAGKAQDRRGEAQGSSSGVQEAPRSHESAASRDESSQRPPKRRCVIMTENYPSNTV